MLKRLLNELTATIEIETESNLLIKDGRLEDLRTQWSEERFPGPANAEIEKQRTDFRKPIPTAIFISRSSPEELREALVDQTKPVDALPFYIPGSSLRGPFRAHLEKVLRSLDAGATVCDPLLDALKGQPSGTVVSCSNALVQEGAKRPPNAYTLSCPVCRLFGNAAQASRVWFSDATFTAKNVVKVDNISVSRHTGSVLNLFKSLALCDATATFEFRVRNFELWHLALLGHLFADAENSLIALGSGKNKGNGKVRATTTEVKLAYYGIDDPCADGTIRGIEHLDDKRAFYDFKSCQVTYRLPAAGAALSWRHERTIPDPSAFWSALRSGLSRGLWKTMKPLETLRSGKGA